MRALPQVGRTRPYPDAPRADPWALSADEGREGGRGSWRATRAKVGRGRDRPWPPAPQRAEDVGAPNGDTLPQGGQGGGAGTGSDFRDLGRLDRVGRIRRAPRQRHGAAASPAGDVARVDLAAICVDALTGDCEPEAQAASVLASLLEEREEVLGT